MDRDSAVAAALDRARADPGRERSGEPVLVLVVGDGELPAAVVRAVERAGGTARRLPHPSDRELLAALQDELARVVIVSHDDIVALRYALVAAHGRPGVPLLVTIFDRTVASEVLRVVPNSHVLSLADAVVPCIAAACLSSDLLAVTGEQALARDRQDGGFRTVELHEPSWLERTWMKARSQLHPFDGSSRLFVAGILGLAALLAVDAALLVAAFGVGPLDAIYETVRTATSVTSSPHADHGPGWYRAFTTAGMILATALIALSTAGLVNQLVSRRLTTILGRRTLPRRDHVVVVGLGQVGLRLCQEMRRLGVPPVAVERDEHTPQVHLARHLGIPVVLGNGMDRSLLQALRADRARAVAAVTSDDLVNIAVSVASLAVSSGVRVVLRAGDDAAVTETRALFPIGAARDVNRIGAELFAAIALGWPVTTAFVEDGTIHLREPDGRVVRLD